MSPATTAISEGDEVALLTSIDGWPIATTGIVIEDHPDYKVIVISEWLGKEVDRISTPTEQLRLIDPATGEVAR